MNRFTARLVRELAPLFYPRAGCEMRSFPATVDLDPEQVEFFRQNGYLVKEGVVAPELIAQTVDHLWTLLPERFDRDDPATWNGLVRDSVMERDLRSREGRVKFRECVRDELWLHEMIDKNRCIRGTVESLLGSDRTPSLPYVRGLYPIFPCEPSPRARPRPHADHHRFLVGVVVYLSDVAPGGGGFHVWPGSHMTMRHCFENYAGPYRTKRYEREAYSVALREPALEITAPAGSAVFWHHRLLHAAGVNRSNQIRHAVLADYPSTDFDDLAKQPVGDDEWRHWRFSHAHVQALSR